MSIPAINSLHSFFGILGSTGDVNEYAAWSQALGQRTQRPAKLLFRKRGKDSSRCRGGRAVYKNIRVSKGHLVGWTALSLSLEKDE